MHILFALATFAALILATELLLRCVPAIADRVLQEDGNERFAALDGLRGLLALGVFMHHTLITHAFEGGNPWQAPASNFDNLLGRAAVALFFMISAYLFWGRVLRKQGRLDWVAFLRGRIGRLAPLFYVALALLLVVVAVETEFTLRVPLSDLARQILRWSSFAFLGTPDINGLAGTWTILSTIWTLPFEWCFYFALPFLALFYRLIGRSWPIYLAITVLALTRPSWIYCLFFVAGGLVAELGVERIDRRLCAIAAIASLIALTIFFHEAEGPLQTILLMPIFVASLQSRHLLQWRPLRFLGHISYSVYLLHNPLLHIITVWILGAATFASLGTLALYGTATIMGLVIILISTLTFIIVEKPFLHTGRSHPRDGIEPAIATAQPKG